MTPKTRVVLDLSRGCFAELPNGKERLIQRGAAAFRRWWGMDPPLDVMRAALGDRPTA
jgi:shikimate 5-dehydrogenase